MDETLFVAFAAIVVFSKADVSQHYTTITSCEMTKSVYNMVVL